MEHVDNITLRKILGRAKGIKGTREVISEARVKDLESILKPNAEISIETGYRVDLDDQINSGESRIDYDGILDVLSLDRRHEKLKN
nr:hypothetical protein [Tanacetum cinerariifolium]